MFLGLFQKIKAFKPNSNFKISRKKIKYLCANLADTIKKSSIDFYSFLRNLKVDFFNIFSK